MQINYTNQIRNRTKDFIDLAIRKRSAFDFHFYILWNDSFIKCRICHDQFVECYLIGCRQQTNKLI